jgi:hypothetical protein
MSIGSMGAGAPLDPAAAELLDRMQQAEGGWSSMLSFLDRSRGVANLAETVLSDGHVTGDDALSLVTEAKDFGGVTEAEHQVLAGLLTDHGDKFATEARAALASFLGVELPAAGEPAPPTGEATNPTAWDNHTGDTSAAVLASRLDEAAAAVPAAATTATGAAAGVGEATTTQPSVGEQMAEGGNAYLNQETHAHLDAIERTGVGTYYGDHSSYKSMSRTERRAWISEAATPGTNPPTPKESSCIGWAMDNVGAAYEAAGMGERWAEIKSIVYAKGVKGTDLAKELQKDGWQAVYFNPDAKHPDDGNAEHSYTARIVKQGKPYYGIDVDAMVTDYRPTEGKGTTQDLAGFEKLKEVPFFFGLAKGGMHTFAGQHGRVNEFHWTANPDDTNAIEERPLTEFPWNSGVIMVPPGTWPDGG